MIVYDLQCFDAHRWEAWFGSSADYDSQAARGLVSCPTCGDHRVGKAAMAPSVAPKGNSRRATDLATLRAKVESECEWVGRDFAARARAAHAAKENGEGAEAKPIYGQATIREACDLLADGVPVAPLPFVPARAADA